MKLQVTLFLLSIAGLLCAADSVPPTLHPQAKQLPTTHQGPFVRTGDGAVLCVEGKSAFRSADEGRTWKESALFAEPKRYGVSNERALLRTKEGVIIAAWMNGVENHAPKGWRWGDKEVSWKEFILPTHTCRSTDDGKTWEPPVKLSEPWCGCIHSMIQLRSGRIVLVGQEIIPQWRHATVMWVSDDLGRSWQRGDVLDYGVGAHDHAGSIEGTVVERQDGSIYLLLRTESGYLWEAESQDGLRWTGFKQSRIRSVTCCPQMARLSDGRIALLWNAPPRHAPGNGTSRAELSLAFSSDETKSWSEPVIVAANYSTGGRVSYPYLFEASPGELWITTMQGGLRMSVRTADLGKGTIPVFKPQPAPEPKPGGIIVFGDSTTAPRGGVEKVYGTRLNEALQSIGSTLAVHNAGIGGNTTKDARARFQRDVLRFQPRVIVMQFGINDSAVDVWKKPPATQPRVPLADYVANLRAMITEARAQKAKVILMTTNPLRWTPKLKDMYGHAPYLPEKEDGFDSPTLASYNDALRKLAAELEVPLVDVRAAYPAFAQSHQTTVEGMLPDGMHPNDLGHQLVAELLLPAVRGVLRKE